MEISVVRGNKQDLELSIKVLINEFERLNGVKVTAFKSRWIGLEGEEIGEFNGVTISVDI